MVVECEKVTKVMIAIIVVLIHFKITKNNVMAIILNAFVNCMTCSSYCWIFVSCIRYFE